MESKTVGTTATAWLTDDMKFTIWPKRQVNEKSWLKAVKMPKTSSELSRSWLKLECKVITYAGEFTYM